MFRWLNRITSSPPAGEPRPAYPIGINGKQIFEFWEKIMLLENLYFSIRLREYEQDLISKMLGITFGNEFQKASVRIGPPHLHRSPPNGRGHSISAGLRSKSFSRENSSILSITSLMMRYWITLFQSFEKFTQLTDENTNMEKLLDFITKKAIMLAKEKMNGFSRNSPQIIWASKESMFYRHSFTTSF